jgi:hypothetical protein
MSVWWLFGSVLVSLPFVMMFHEWWENWLFERDLYPSPSRTSLADVKELAKRGCRKEAILLYREKFPQVDLREAVYAVDSLGR